MWWLRAPEERHISSGSRLCRRRFCSRDPAKYFAVWNNLMRAIAPQLLLLLQRRRRHGICSGPLFSGGISQLPGEPVPAPWSSSSATLQAAVRFPRFLANRWTGKEKTDGRSAVVTHGIICAYYVGTVSAIIIYYAAAREYCVVLSYTLPAVTLTHIAHARRLWYNANISLLGRPMRRRTWRNRT